MQAPNKPFLKVPARLFRDFSPDGPLATIGLKCAELMKAKAQKRIDWASPATRKENTDLVLRIRQELLRAGHMSLPRVFVRPDCPNPSLLRHTVTKLGGELAHAEDAPGVTHVLCPFGPSGDPDDNKEYLRTLEVAGGAAKVHWWYLPDSYDEWLPAAAAPSEVEPDVKPPGGRPWKVFHRFLLDSEKYNEWMNEADYETEEAAAENKKLRESGEGAEEMREKKRLKRTPGAVEVAPGVLEAVAPGAVTRRLLNPHAGGLNPTRVEDISHGQQQEWEGPPVGGVWGGGEDGGEKKMDGGKAVASPQYVVPAKATWFTYTDIHSIEREAFPEFFTPPPPPATDQQPQQQQQERTAGQYRDIRNFIIDLFRKDPSKDLKFTDALLRTDGDANDVRKVFDFLLRWGLINWRVEGGKAAAMASRGGAPPTGTDALLHIEQNPGALEAAEAFATGMPSRVTVRPGTFTSAVPQAPAIATGVRYFCNVHPYEDCTELRYHCTKLPDVDLCPQAYADGRFPPGCSSKDFVRVAATDPVHDASGWSDEETLLLLEAMDMYGENWNKIAEHVGGRSPLQCIQRVLQLPVEDALLPQPGSGGVQLSKSLGDASANGGDVKGPLPFADAGNPVMAQIAFLTTMVGPRVAAAAAQRALEVLAEEDANGGGTGGTGTSDGGGANGLPESRVRAAAAAGLAAAAVKSRLMADAEEREMQRLVVAACENQLRRVQAKLAHLEKVDELLKNEFVPLAQKAIQYEAELEKLKRSK